MPGTKMLGDSKKWHINPYRYRELYYKCLQYPELKRQAEDLTNSLKAVSMDGLPKGSGNGDPTQTAAMKLMEINSKLEPIETALHEVCDDELYPFMLYNVAHEIPYDQLCFYFAAMVPMGRQKFYQVRRRFFYVLDKKEKNHHAYP